MAYCSNCGAKLADSAKFCSECGAPITSTSASASERQQEYAGKILKCPNCGEVLKSFEGICPACGFELRNTGVSKSVNDFTQTLKSAVTNEQRVLLIRNFPIPNNKEDIFEFMILASTNINGQQPTSVFDAWSVKFEQSYQKALLVFGDESYFPKAQDIYQQTQKKIKKEKQILDAKARRETLSKNADALPSIIIASVWIISLFVFITLEVTRDSYDSVLFTFDLIFGAIAMPSILRCDSSAPKLIVFFGLGITLVALAIIEKTVPDSLASVMLVFDVITTAVIVFRGVLKTKKAKENNCGTF